VQVDGFVSTVEDARSSHPVWFGLESDALASSDDVGAAEAALGVEFPSAYREFVMRFGGRYGKRSLKFLSASVSAPEVHGV